MKTDGERILELAVMFAEMQTRVDKIVDAINHNVKLSKRIDEDRVVRLGALESKILELMKRIQSLERNLRDQRSNPFGAF